MPTDSRAAREQFKARVRRQESGGNDRARNPRGSASGRYQFIDSTFQALYQRVYRATPQQARQAWNSDRRFSPDVQERLMDAALDEYEAEYRRHGIPLTSENLYLAHFFGPQPARRVIRAPAGTPVERIVGAAAVRSNPEALGPVGRSRSVQDVVAWAGRAMGGRHTPASGQGGAAPAAPVEADIPDWSSDQLFSGDLDEAFVRRQPPVLRPDRGQREERVLDAMTGGQGITRMDTPRSSELVGATQQIEDADAAEHSWNESIGFGERVAASLQQNTIVGSLIDAFNREEVGEDDPAFLQRYRANPEIYESEGRTDEELAMLRGARNQEHMNRILGEIQENRMRERIIDSSGNGTAWRIGASIADPVGLAAGVGVGKAFQVLGVGSTVLARQGRVAAAIMSSAGEGVVGNLAFTAALDALGEYTPADQYAMNALTGAALGTLVSPLAVMEGRRLGPLPEAPTGPAWIDTYHGSPHDPLDRFDNTKIGTGEGNAAFGHGTYTTENFRIGRWYWDTLTGARREAVEEAAEGTATRDLLDGLGFRARDWATPPEVRTAAAQGILRRTVGMARDAVVSFLRGVSETFRRGIAAITDPTGARALELDDLRFKAEFSTRLADQLENAARQEKGGTIYQTRIRNGEYLDLDKTVGEQTAAVQEALRKAGYGGDAAATGRQAYDSLGDPVRTSTALRENGVLGNKYLTGVARKGDTADEYNYVTYSDQDIAIVSDWTPTRGWQARADTPDWATSKQDYFNRAISAHEANLVQATEKARAELGPDASDMEVRAKVLDNMGRDYAETIKYALADIPEDQRLLVTKDPEGTDPANLEGVAEEHNLSKLADDAEAAMVAELISNANRIVDMNPYDRAKISTFLERLGQEAPATRLLKSNSPVARAAALTLLENPSGIGGRRRTAAITQALRERAYNEHFAAYDGLAAGFRRDQGVGVLKDTWDGTSRNEFNNRVFYEVEQRMDAPTGTTFDDNPWVLKAADLFTRGMDMMRMDQQRVGTVGHLRLGDTSQGYMPHRLDVQKVMGLTERQLNNIRTVVARQVQASEGWDEAFAKKFAAQYIQRPRDAAHGRYHVPMNLYSAEAAQGIEDALRAIGIAGDDLQRALGKFSRGGAGHTKQRTKLDLAEEIGDGLRLGDIFVSDVPTLYRSYARRVAGEVALAQYGVLGKRGLQLMSRAISESGGSASDIKAFDQISAEFLNTPFGEANYKWLDNLRVATSSARLGMMGANQFGEFTNAVPALGLAKAGQAIADIPRLLGEVHAFSKGEGKPNPILQSVDRMGGRIGMEDYHMTRMFDIRDNQIELYNGESMDALTRAIRGSGNAMMVASGHRMIMAVQTRGMAEQIIRKAVQYAKSGTHDIALRDMGFSDDILRALRDDLDNVATWGKGGELESLDLFKGQHLKPEHIAEITQAVERGAAQIIQRTYIGEVGAWAHNGLLRFLLQFRTFSLTAVEKQWGRNAHNYGAMKAAVYLMGAMSLALPIHLSRVQLRMIGMTASERREYAEREMSEAALIRATMNYASASGIAGDIWDLGAGAFSTYGGDIGDRLGIQTSDLGGRGSRGAGLENIVPGVGYLNDILRGVGTGDPEKVFRALPGSNLPYVTPFLNVATQEE